MVLPLLGNTANLQNTKKPGTFSGAGFFVSLLELLLNLEGGKNAVDTVRRPGVAIA